MVDDVLINKASSIERCVARARDVFQLLSQGGWVSPSLLTNLKNMVGFRNVAVHE